MSVKSADNFQIREHLWLRLFHIIKWLKWLHLHMVITICWKAKLH